MHWLRARIRAGLRDQGTPSVVDKIAYAAPSRPATSSPWCSSPPRIAAPWWRPALQSLDRRRDFCPHEPPAWTPSVARMAGADERGGRAFAGARRGSGAPDCVGARPVSAHLQAAGPSASSIWARAHPGAAGWAGLSVRRSPPSKRMHGRRRRRAGRSEGAAAMHLRGGDGAIKMELREEAARSPVYGRGEVFREPRSARIRTRRFVSRRYTRR